MAPRLPGKENPRLKTGGIEVRARELAVYNATPTPPFEMHGPEPNEELRLTYRYLDLRRPAMHEIFILRHRLAQLMRRTMSDLGFLEVETPVLGRSTPEGARDFLVASRLHPGHFYALPQSPQLYKQLLMVSGFDRYFQIARCFRDEDLRANRQPEFTQLDVEMSFVDDLDVTSTMGILVAAMAREFGGEELELPVAAARISRRRGAVRQRPARPALRARAQGRRRHRRPDRVQGISAGQGTPDIGCEASASRRRRAVQPQGPRRAGRIHRRHRGQGPGLAQGRGRRARPARRPSSSPKPPRSSSASGSAPDQAT